MPSVSGGDGGDGSGRPPPQRVRRRDNMRGAQQSAEQVRGSSHMEGQVLLPGQRQDHAEGLRAQEHAVVLRRGDICRQRHQTHAEQREEQVQTH